MITLQEAEQSLRRDPPRRVVYLPNGETGYITGVSQLFIFVRYDGDSGGTKATHPSDLRWAVDEVPLPRVALAEGCEHCARNGRACWLHGGVGAVTTRFDEPDGGDVA